MKLSDLFSNYFTVRKELVAAVDNLTPGQLAFTAPNHANSIGWLLTHIAETEEWWVSTVALRREDYREEDFDRFKAASRLDEYLGLLIETFDATSAYLEAEPLEDWDRVFYRVHGVGEDGKPFDYKVSKRWLVWHVVEHQARHRGQIFMLLRMQGLEVPDV
jgi:uncharacterized damage-inducible protein DinB